MIKDARGFTSNSGEFIWSKCTVLGLNQVYISARCMNVDFYSTELAKAKDLIKQGYPLLAEVDFNPATDLPDMHFVLLAGVSDNNELLVVDPWEGQWETWSDGAAKRNIYQFRQYDKKLPLDDGSTQVSVESKVFENLVRKATNYDTICQSLNTGDNMTLITIDLEKFKTLEEAVREKDKVIETAQTKVGELESKVKQLQEDHEQFALASTKTIQEQDKEISSLEGAIQELKKDCKPQLEYTGIKKWIYEIFLK